MIIILIMAVFLTVFVIAYFRCSFVKLDPSQCQSSLGTYVVKPGYTLPTLQTCGVNNNENCTFDATNLTSAVDICDNNSDKCQGFSYTPDLETMSYVDNNATLVVASGIDLYRRLVD
jgi:hypothetical protein